ncbi:MAG: efflux RND transporter periplasmic adaptor subunit [Candidatus Aminicenantes bacterium]|nr:efflux RND transporter periplasmic adaptor subunit [Candidatus Aminicenantes bacterium]
MNKIIKIVSFVILIAVILFGGYQLFFNSDISSETEIIKAEEKGSEGEPVRTSSIPVKVAEIMKGELPLRLRVSATAQVKEKTVIKSEVSGKVQSINVNIGDWVKRGQLLVKIEDTEKRLEVERAKTNKLKSLAEYLINSGLEEIQQSDPENFDAKKVQDIKEKYLAAIKNFRNGKISEKEFDNISDEYDKIMVSSGSWRENIRKVQDGLAEAIIALKQAELNLKKTYIYSPFQGRISELKVSKGEIISNGQEILKVVNLKSVYLEGFALESEIKNLKIGTQVRVKFDSYSDRYFRGDINAISPEVDQVNKTITLYIKINNDENLILPGMHAEIDVEYMVFKDIIKVPVRSIIVRQERPLIFVVNGKTVNWVYVDLGPRNDEEQIIKNFHSEVNPGDLVVISGHSTLAHQSRIKIIK